MTDDIDLAALSCTLPEGEAAARRIDVGRVFARATQSHPLHDGVELEYPGDDETARALFDFVLLERRCCAQLSYELRFDPERDQVRLRITGSAQYVNPIRKWAEQGRDGH